MRCDLHMTRTPTLLTTNITDALILGLVPRTQGTAYSDGGERPVEINELALHVSVSCRCGAKYGVPTGGTRGGLGPRAKPEDDIGCGSGRAFSNVIRAALDFFTRSFAGMT